MEPNHGKKRCNKRYSAPLEPPSTVIVVIVLAVMAVFMLVVVMFIMAVRHGVVVACIVCLD
jgi:hypothetical protein